jgi:hypothetical protein
MTHPKVVIRRAAPLIILVTSIQLYSAFTLKTTWGQNATALMDIPQQGSISDAQFVPRPHLNKNESFGACLMMKEDNDLLYEWLAYHYTVLPLRYILVGSDEGNKQDPRDVLQRWTQANTGLNYWILNSTEFMLRHGKHKGKEGNNKDDAHHTFIHRQRGFITTCSEFMKSQGVHWVTFIDSDEFVVMNRMGEDDKRFTIRTRNEPMSITQTSSDMRKALPAHDSDATVLDAIKKLEPIESLSPCYTIPRLLYGAFENLTCPGTEPTNELAKKEFKFSEMSTLRFLQHGRKGDFALSKFGKVIVDFSNLTEETIAQTPRNIHRPWKSVCGPGVVHFPEAIFYLSHYIGSWERYSSRKDARRNRNEWEQRAFITSGSSCDKAVYKWFPRFVKAVGLDRARFLLGVDQI